MIIKISNESFQSVPVFPLKNVQLFPHTILPLNIFEPRYIAMIDYALENDHLITIGDTQFDTPNHRVEEWNFLLYLQLPSHLLHPLE